MAIKFRRQRNDAMCQWATSTVATATSVPSPNLNPIDSFSVKFKHLLRKAAARSTETIRVMIGPPIAAAGRDPREVNAEAQAWIEAHCRR